MSTSSSSSKNKKKKKILLNTISVDLGCSCRRPKLSSIFAPKPKSKSPKYHKHHLSQYSSSTRTTTTSTSTSTSGGRTVNSCSPVSTFSSSVAVEKESSDPYLDFRQSMLQMIVENELYSEDELRHLLGCFLQLNCSSVHGVIIRAFNEIWNGFFYSQSSYQRFFVPKGYQM